MSPRLAALLVASGVALGGTEHARADRQLWIDPTLGYSPARRVDLDLSAQVRFDQDWSRFSAFLPEATAHYRIKRWVRVGGGYRLEYERDGNGVLVVRHRVSGDARFRLDRGPVRVDYRLMLVEQIRPSSGNQYRAVLRNRVEVAYLDAGRLRPFAGIEIFHMLDDLDQADYDRTRLTVGTSFDAGDHELELFLRAQLHADPMEETFYILGLGYHYQL